MQTIILGEEEAVLGFSLVGVEGRIAADAPDAALQLRRALDSEPALVFVTDTVAAWIRPQLAAAMARGASIQLVAGPHASTEGRARDPEAELLSALGVKI